MLGAWWPVGALLLAALASSQRYAERTPLPPSQHDYDAEYGFDDDEEGDIYRWNVADFPHPRDNPRYCNRLRSSGICDPDMILDREQADRLDAMLAELQRNSPCVCEGCKQGEGGVVAGIALLKNLYQPYNEHPAKIVRSFAERLRTSWKLGSCDNDLLVLLATSDRLFYADVGPALGANLLPLHSAHRVFLEHRALFSEGRFYEGLAAVLSDYTNHTNMAHAAQKGDELNMGAVTGGIIGAVLTLGIMLFILFIIYRRCKNKKEDPEKAESRPSSSQSEGVSSSWTKRDIRVMFNSLTSTNKSTATKDYQPCNTDDKDFSTDEIIDTTLAVPAVTMATERLDDVDGKRDDVTMSDNSAVDNAVCGDNSGSTNEVTSDVSGQAKSSLPNTATDSSGPAVSSESSNGCPATSSSSDVIGQPTNRLGLRGVEIKTRGPEDAPEKAGPTNTFGTFLPPRREYRGHQTDL